MGKDAINEKSTILVQFCSYFQGLTASWVGKFLKVWAKLDNNCGFFINNIYCWNSKLGWTGLYIQVGNFEIDFALKSLISFRYGLGMWRPRFFPSWPLANVLWKRLWVLLRPKVSNRWLKKYFLLYFPFIEKPSTFRLWNELPSLCEPIDIRSSMNPGGRTSASSRQKWPISFTVTQM